MTWLFAWRAVGVAIFNTLGNNRVYHHGLPWESVPIVSTKILIVDDESSVRRLLKRCFEGAGYEVVEADSGETLFSQLDRHRVDLVTLDIGLGQEDGLELARMVRQKRSVPIIMVTGKGDLIDTVVGLEVGADDYISKPFELREVIARVKAVLRRYDSSPSNQDASGLSSDRSVSSSETEGEHSSGCYRFNDWVLDTASRELTDPEQQPCELTTAEYELLKLFVMHSRQVLTRDQIMDRLKGNEWVPTDRTIDNQVSRLRRKFQLSDTGTQIIKTVRGAGYMFNASVEKQ